MNVMLQPATFKFLRDLKKNNNKTWFEKHKPTYLEAKGDMEIFVQTLIDRMGKIDGNLKTLQPKDCQFRIYRDVRFSKDKTPYKTHMGAYFNKGGKKSLTAGYYFHLEPGKCQVGGGCWMPLAPELQRVRQEIDYNFDEWRKILGERSFRKFYPQGLDTEYQLSRPPKGYDEENPAIDFLKLKSFFVTRPLTDAELQSKIAIKQILQPFEALFGLVQFLNRAIE